MTVRVGTICYSHSRGLGHLAKSFIDAGVINDICVVQHPNIPMKDWYPNAPITNVRNVHVSTQWLKQHDAILCFETPFDWKIINECKRYGIKTFLVTMYECTPEILPAIPDVLLCPSLLDLQEFESYKKQAKVKLCHIPVEVPWSLRTTAQHFVHNGGYLGMRGREGTELLIEAMALVRSPIRLTIRVQENVSPRHQKIMAQDNRIEYVNRSVPYEELYRTGDVSILPQKFNGMSMPLLESRASGMAICTTDRFPTNEWLNGEGHLISSRGSQIVRLSPRFRPIGESIISPHDIAQTIDSLYSKDISTQSRQGLEWATRNNWVGLRSHWQELLEC